VGLFHHFYIRSDSSMPVHFVAHSRARDCYVADLSICISLMPLLSTAELGTESAAELRSGPATKLGVIAQRS
jgi:hypothetical protein